MSVTSLFVACVQSGVYDKFAEIFAAKVKALKVGVDEGCQQGPLINAAAVDKVEKHVADAVAKGGKILVGGKRVPHSECKQLFAPTVLINANPVCSFSAAACC